MEDIFCSRRLSDKRPFGAVETGVPVQFTVHLPLDYSFSTVTLCVYDGISYLEHIVMSYQKTENEQIFYRVTYTPEVAGVYFYYFSVQHENHTIFIKRSTGGFGIFSQDAPDFQLTVANRNSKTPDFIKGGIFYQIFPDRFCSSGIRHNNVPSDRILRADWGGMPYFLPDENGEIKNNDYFCGDLKGIEEKLPYLKTLGVTMIYLNPIFEAHSSHRYNTADYFAVDPLLGTEADFRHLCLSAKKIGIRILLDGVFSHTGDDSKYFNRKGRYSSVGAYESQTSPYYPWYHFINYPDQYDSWWGFDTLPTIQKGNPDYIEFICGENGVLRYWLRAGASGFRLDVADELPDFFIERIRQAVKAEGEENLLIGEVWEDASNKMAYGVRRRYFLGDELDSVMNYPFKDAILSFLRYQNQEEFIERIETIVENYPSGALHTAMNSLSTHDTERAITVLVGEPLNGRDRQWQSHHYLTLDQYQNGVRLLKLAMTLQYFLPGVPCIYYGDEAGLQGYRDPFNRACYPWGAEQTDLIPFLIHLANLRKEAPALKDGMIQFLQTVSHVLAFRRTAKDGETVLFLNYGEHPVQFPSSFYHYRCPHGHYQKETGHITIPPSDFALLTKRS